MFITATQKLRKLWTSNAWGEVDAVRYLDHDEQLESLEALRDHWQQDNGWDVSGFTVEDMREFLEAEQRDLPRHYCTGDGVVENILQAKDAVEAMDLAIDWWAEGSWENRTELDIFVREINPWDDDMEFPMDWKTIEVGEDPPEPDCEGADEHDWRSPHSVLSGLKENPGVWSEGGTRMVFRKVCKHCGCYRTETSVGAQRNPGELDRIEYDKPDEVSLRWVSKFSKEEA